MELKKYWFEIADQLSFYQFNLRSKGYEYWIDAIEIYIENNLSCKIGEIYEKIARKHNTTKSRVERALRTAKEPAIKIFKEKRGKDVKFTNGIILKILCYEVLKENKEKEV